MCWHRQFVVRFAALCLAAVVVAQFARRAGAATIAHWRFEGNLLDETANNNDATAVGTSFSSDVFGSPVPSTGAANSMSLQLDNTPGLNNAAHYLTVPHDPSLNIATGSFTIEAWVNMDEVGSVSERQYIVHKKDQGVTDEGSSFVFLSRAGSLVPLGNNQGVLALGLHDGVSNTVSGENYVFSSLAIDQIGWHHVSVALDRTTGDVRFTLDDQVDFQPGAAAGPLLAGQDNDDTLFIGAHPTGATPPNPPNEGFDGLLDEVRISNTFLSTSELLPVPEPASLLTLFAGVTLLLGWRIWTSSRRNNCTRN